MAMQGRSPILLLRALLLSAAVVTTAAAEEAIPHAGPRAATGFESYRYADDHRAFAIAPGGAWAWRAGLESPDAARDAALEACAEHTEQRCVPYAVGDRVVFDRAAWPTLWRPYLSKDDAAVAAVGPRRGQRMPDLAFRTADGAPRTLADLRGRIVILHFWGSWCPPCMRELPLLQRFAPALHERLGAEVELVLLQVREPFADATAFLARNGLDGLPLHDSGASGPEDTALALAGGGALPDREVAARFPTSYVLDRHGVVLFRHVGPIDDWDAYLPFLEDVVAVTVR